MAISIRPTPTLTGEHAERFLSKIEEDKENKIDFTSQIEKAKKIIEKSKSVERK